MTTPTHPENSDFEALLHYVRDTRGFDFTGYKRPSIMRRIDKRMQVVGVSAYRDYLDVLETNPDEFGHLFDTILINVTNFFRDGAPWDYLRDEYIPAMLAQKQPGDPIRVWSAGCASGEEAYTMAMLLAEALGVEQYRERVKIYASDVDEHALTQARLASYSRREVNAIPPDLLEKHFDEVNGHFVFRKDFRRAVIFGRHDLIQDAPISHIDILTCRNTLMYFNVETQSKILSRFHFALNDTGVLVLGKAEMLFAHRKQFVPLDLKRRLFRKVNLTSGRDRVFLSSDVSDDGLSHEAQIHRFREAAFDAGANAQIAVDEHGIVTLANERARALFGLTTRDQNRPLHELDLAYRIPDLKARMDDVLRERRAVQLKDVDWQVSGGESRRLEITIAPVMEAGDPLGVIISVLDITQAWMLQEKIEHANQELETAYEELQSTNEELETTNEELQSTVEGLETTKEELQSTNEELETINEEFQSANEELQTMNDELRHRTDELNDNFAFTDSILSNLKGGVVVVNGDMLVSVWSRNAEELWGLRSREVINKNLLTLDIGLPVDQLAGPLRACLSGEKPHQELRLDATNRRGKRICCKVTLTMLNQFAEENKGVILMMEEVEP